MNAKCSEKCVAVAALVGFVVWMAVGLIVFADQAGSNVGSHSRPM